MSCPAQRTVAAVQSTVIARTRGLLCQHRNTNQSIEVSKIAKATTSNPALVTPKMTMKTRPTEGTIGKNWSHSSRVVLHARAEAKRKHTPPRSKPETASAPAISDQKLLAGLKSVRAKCARINSQPAIQ